MKIGEVSKQLGISASAIRYYESEGLLPPQSRISGRREFGNQALLKLRFIQLAQNAGFSIKEMKALLENWDSAAEAGGIWHDVARSKQKEVAEKLRKLQRMDEILRMLIECQCESLKACVQLADKTRH